MMTRWSCAVAAVFLVACSSGSKPQRPSPNPDLCGGEACVAGQRCDLSTLRCVLDEAPRLTLHAPLNAVSAARFEVTGSVSDDGEGTTLEWHEEVGEWQPVVLAADGTFTIMVPARELDAEPVLVTVRANDGTTQVEQSTIVIVDRVGPVLELTAPTPGTVVAGTSATVTVIARDGSDALQELTIAGQRLPSPHAGTASSAQVPVPAGSLRGLEVLVSAQDVSGNRTERTFTVQVDGAGPTLRFVAPTAQTPTLHAPSFRVEVEATDPSAVQQVRVAMEDGGFVEATAAPGDTWVAELPLPAIEAEATFTAQATDAVGNRSELRSAPVQIDRVAPTVGVVGPAADVIVSDAFQVAALAGPGTTSVSATFAGTTVALHLTATEGRWEGEMTLAPTARDYAEESLVAVARDAAGNERTSAPHRLFIDTLPPQVTFTAPAQDARLNRSQFVSSDDVTVSWQVHDADPAAATSSVNAEPSSANEVRVTTSPSDDGRSITTTVVAQDRAHHLTTASLTFTVDRVAPTLVSWLPAANARNVEPRLTTVTFSEKVLGPTSASDALVISPGLTQPGTWDAAHTTWTSADLGPYAVFTADFANLTDLAGNPLVAPPGRKFHTAAFVPASGTVLASGVQSFKVASDADGVATLSLATATSFSVQGLSPVSGTLGTRSIDLDRVITDYELNAWAAIDPVTLVSTHRVGSSYRVAGELHRHAITDGTAVPTSFIATSGAAGAVISVPAFSGEADASSFAVTNATGYQRGAASAVLSTSPNLVAQSGYTWAGFSTSASAISWSRYLCIPSRFGAPTCTSYAFSSAATNPTELRAVISPTSRCLVASWNSGSTRSVLYQPLALCNEPRLAGTPPHPSCQNNPGPSPLGSNTGRFAPFSANGENTILGASFDASGLRLAKMTNPTACTKDFTPLGSPLAEAVTAFEPVQLGNKPAVLYIDASSHLKLFVP